MPSSYLQSGDFSTFGVPASTTAGQVTQASVLIDAYLKRTEGLVWMPDGAGNPSYMAALTPRLSLTASTAIAPGKNVVVPVTGGIDAIAIGDALVLASGALLDQGLAIKQHLFMPKDRPVKTLAYTPVVRLLSGQGRYAYGRRGDSSRYMVDEFNLLASLTAFGGPPAWEFFPLISTGIDPETGQVWVPAGVMLAYYSEVNLWYVAGYAQANLPDQIKMACAQVINATAAFPEIASTGIKSLRAGDTQIQMFASSILSDDSKRYLDPFRAKLFV
jgi:hypothetical protein